MSCLLSSLRSRRPGTHLAAFSSVGIRPGIPPSSALRCTHLNDANRKRNLGDTTLMPRWT